MGFVGGQLPRDFDLSLHACDCTSFPHGPEGSFHIRATVLTAQEMKEYSVAWTRKSSSRRVLELLDQEFQVQVPADLCGIELEDMFVDAETGRRFFYAPNGGSVHFLDRERSPRKCAKPY